MSATTSAVGASNSDPKFADSDNDGTPDPVTRTVAENSTGDVGSAVAASDPDEGDTLTYSVAATDDQDTAAVAAKDAFDTNFEIDSDGQISVKSGATIDTDYETHIAAHMWSPTRCPTARTPPAPPTPRWTTP